MRHSVHSTVGVGTIRTWIRKLPPRASILDLGCGPGTPRSEPFFTEGCVVSAIDAAPTLACAYQSRFPAARVACEVVEESSFFGATFDGVLAWGLMFLLPADTQQAIIARVAGALKNGGRFLFTAPVQECSWADLSTGRTSISLGLATYSAILSNAGFRLVAGQVDEGENHYYDAVKVAEKPGAGWKESIK